MTLADEIFAYIVKQLNTPDPRYPDADSSPIYLTHIQQIVTKYMNHETIKKSNGITFDQWLEALRMYAGSIHPQHIQYVDDTRQSWFDYYEDDDTPKFALDEDMSYWE